MGFKNRGWRWLAALFLAASLVGPALGRTVLDLDPDHQPVALQDWGDAWMDATGEATVDKSPPTAAIAWAPTRQGAIYPLTTGKALWIRFTVPPAPDAERWYLEIPYPSVNRVTLYTPDSTGQWVGQSAGDTLPVADWPVPHRHPLLPIVVSAEEPRKYLLRVENPHSFSAPLSFVSESYLSRHEQRTSLILGIFFGLAGLAVMLGVLSAVSLRDSAYALLRAQRGPDGPEPGRDDRHRRPAPVARPAWWNDLSSMVLPVLAVGSLVWFFSAVVSLPERSRRLHQLLAGLALLAIVTAAGMVLVPPSYRFRLLVPYIVVAASVSDGCDPLGGAARRPLCALAAGRHRCPS